MLHFVSGNLLDSDAKYIVHQCNCISTKSAHLAKDIFVKYPYSNEYENRTHPSVPGTISIKGNGEDQRYIISLFGQFYPGAPKYQTGKDTKEIRKTYFYNGLKEILKIPNLQSIGLPDHIGCGAAGGDWDFYRGLIEKFASVIPDVEISVYKLC